MPNASPETIAVAEAVEKHFDATVDEYAARYAKQSNAGYSFRMRKQRVLEMFDQPGGAVLDVGCGPGVVVDELVSGQGCEFWGVDVAAEMIKHATEQFSGDSRIHFAVGSVEELGFSSESFDCVLAMGLVEYLVDPRDAIREMLRVLKPGGTLIVTLPNVQSPFRIWQRLVWKPLVRGPVGRIFPIFQKLITPVFHREFKFDTHRKMYEELGAVVEDVVYYNFKPFPSPLDYLLRGLQLQISARLERHGRSRARFIGTGFIVKVRKPLR